MSILISSFLIFFSFFKKTLNGYVTLVKNCLIYWHQTQEPIKSKLLYFVNTYLAFIGQIGYNEYTNNRKNGTHMAAKKTPQYKQIENKLMEQIRLGYYKINDMVPKEMELADMFGVSRVTVRKALDDMANMGMIRRVPGVGTFIQKNAAIEKVTQTMGFTQEMISLNKTPRTVVTSFQIIQASSNIARILHLNANNIIYHYKRERYADEVLFLVEESYMPTENRPEISLQILQGSKYNYFENVRGEKIAYNEHHVEAIHPTTEIARLFQIAEDTPILKVANLTYLMNGSILDYTIQIYNSPKYQVHYIKQRNT